MKKGYIEIVVGLFMIAGFAGFVYLSLQLGEFSIFSMGENYTLKAEFENVSGLKQGATVEISGVLVGKVLDVTLDKNGMALVTMLINKQVKVGKDAIASIRTQGIIGDKYIRIINGSLDALLKNNDMITDTESAVDIEELVSKYIFGGV
jgi:phospholipid/cholesterol/gamma-HCH transport system substrate-binding protein